MNKKLILILSILVILLTTVSCYYRLLIRADNGFLMYRAIHWDIRDFTLPRLIYNSDSIRMGIFPLWNPYPFGGVPWVSNFQSFLFHPLNLLIIFTFGYSAEIIQHQLFVIFFISGISMYLCAREFSASQPASLLSAISFLSCGFFVGNASHFGQINTLAIFPLCFLMTNKIIRTPNLYNLSVAAICFAIMVFSGYPTMGFFFAMNCGFYGVIRILFINKDVPYRRSLIFFGGVFIIAILLSSILLIPALESSLYITRTKCMDTSPETVLTRSLYPYNFLTLPFPFLGLKNLSPYNLDKTLRNSSIGIIGLCFAVYFLIFNKTRLKWLLASLFILNIILSLGFNTPVYKFAYNYLFPIKIVSHPAFAFRAGFLFFLCLAAGMGADTFLKNCKSEKKKLISSSIILMTLSLIALAYAEKMIGDSGRNFFSQHYRWVVIFTIFITLIAIKLPRKLLFIFLIVLSIYEVSHWAKINFGTIAVSAPEGYWLRRHKKEAMRCISVDSAHSFKRKHEFPSIKGARSMYWKYFSDSGYDSTQLESFQTTMRSPAKEILSEDFRLLPVYKVEILNDKSSVLNIIRQETDIHTVALINRQDIGDGYLLEKLEGISKSEARGGDFQGDITYYSPNVIKYELSLDNPAVIFFNEIYYPGWILKEGDIKIPLFEINYAFRGAYLEEGHHKLIMEFSPRSFKLGLILSSLTALFCFGTIITSSVKSVINNKLSKMGQE